MSARSQVRVCTVDAFTSRPFAGNPAAVCLLEKDIDDQMKQKIAAELNLSETAYVTRTDPTSTFETASRFALRWFTPSTEVPLCGHATLAAAKVIFAVRGNPNRTLTFATLSGDLHAQRSADKIVLSLPRNHAEQAKQDDFQHIIQTVSCGLPVKECQLSRRTGKLIVRLEDSVNRDQLEGIRPDVNSLLLQQQKDVKGVIVTMKGDGVQYDFLSRYFAPWVGINEDPVTGSAHTVLAPYWAQQLNRSILKARQCSPRGGDLDLVLEESCVRVAGSSVVVLTGDITID